MANLNNLGCGPLTVKYLVFIFNFIFFLSGLLLIVVGGVAQGFFVNKIQFFDNRFETPAIGLIILGSIILVISFFGCCGAKRENVFMLRVFAFLMVLMLLLQFAAAITFAVLRPQIEELVQKNMNETMHKYDEPKALVTQTWDDLQQTYHCCGTFNYTDWKDTSYGLNVTGVPDSCCKTRNTTCGHDIFSTKSSDTIYKEGCYNALKDSSKRYTGAIIGGVVGLALLQMIGVWMSCCLIKAVKERYEIL